MHLIHIGSLKLAGIFIVIVVVVIYTYIFVVTVILFLFFFQVEWCNFIHLINVYS